MSDSRVSAWGVSQGGVVRIAFLLSVRSALPIRTFPPPAFNTFATFPFFPLLPIFSLSPFWLPLQIPGSMYVTYYDLSVTFYSIVPRECSVARFVIFLVALG